MLYHKGIVTCRLEPAIIITFGVKLIVFVEFTPVVSLLLVKEQPVMMEGQNCIVDCPVPRAFSDASLIKKNNVSGVPVPPPQGLVIAN